ncbi:DUF6657 family protein [Salinispira pacifica]|uniref:Uncharacterized protein n=1 Tax=Salinispira pacifica TaxID=1307761 RepID=V5WEZ8_9SPIO|nr:DUF6657 family protein [Salinispira pacifica]AHC13746.1 hypothetical protein L21SP2_0306 [Salinispira pacifica]
MGYIKSALELALERTEDIKADSSSLKAREHREAGMRLMAELEKGNEDEVEKELKQFGKDERKEVLSGLMDSVLARITLPSTDQSLDDISIIAGALKFLFPGNKAMEGVPEQLREFYQNYLQDKERLLDALKERFADHLKQKEEQMARQTGQRMSIRPEMDPEFNKALQANLEHLDGQYQQVIDNVRRELKQNFGG